jgi:hypothetical protein
MDVSIDNLKKNEMATRFPIRWVQGLSLGVEGSGRVKLATHKGKNEWSCNSSSPICLRGVYSDITFPGLLFHRLCHYITI